MQCGELNNLKREKFRIQIRKERTEELFKIKRLQENNYQIIEYLNSYYDDEETYFRDKEEMIFYFNNPEEIVSFKIAKEFLLMMLDFPQLKSHSFAQQIFYHCFSIVKLNIEKQQIQQCTSILKYFITELNQRDAFLITSQLSSNTIMRSQHFVLSIVDQDIFTVLIKSEHTELSFKIIINLLSQITIAEQYFDNNQILQYLHKQILHKAYSNYVIGLLETLSNQDNLAFLIAQTKLIEETQNFTFDDTLLNLFINLTKNTNIFYYQFIDIQLFFRKLFEINNQNKILVLQLIFNILIKYEHELKLKEIIKLNLSYIEQSQHSQNNQIRNLSYLILDNYFNDLYEDTIK